MPSENRSSLASPRARADALGLGALVRSEAGASLALAILFGVSYVLISRVAFRGFPFSGDEYSYYLQGEIFAKGALAVPAPAHPELFTVDHVVIDALVRSKYPPGTSALLALGFLVHAPWIVTPLEALATLLFLRHAARVTYGERAALVAVMVAGSSALFTFHAASFYAHAATTLWLAAALAAIAEWAAHARARWLVAAGVAIGLAFLTRPLDAAAFGVAMLALRSPRAVIWTALAALPVAALTFAYNAALFGGPLHDGYHAYEPTFRATYGALAARHAVGVGFLFDAEYQWHHLDALREVAVEWTMPGAIFCALLGARAAPGEAARARALRHFAIGVAVATLLSILPTISDPDDGLRPRYLSTLVLPLALLAGPGWIAIADRLRSAIGDGWIRALAAVSLALGVLGFAGFLDKRLPALWEREGLYREVADRGIHDAVVIVRAKYPTRYLRNGPSFDRSVLYVMPDVASATTLADWFPGRTVYEAAEGRPWTIRRIVPAS